MVPLIKRRTRTNTKIKSDWQSLRALLECSKVLTSLTSVLVKSEINLNDFLFAFSCIIACLFHGIVILKEVNYYESGTFVGFRSKKRSSFPNGVETGRILTRINVLLCQIMSLFLEYICNRHEECQSIRSNHAFYFDDNTSLYLVDKFSRCKK